MIRIMKYTIVTFTTLIVGCQSVVDIEVPLDPPSLVVNGRVESDGKWRFSVGKSMHILDLTSSMTVEEDGNVLMIRTNNSSTEINKPVRYDNASIVVYKDDQELYRIPSIGEGKYFFHASPLEMSAEYSMKISVPGIKSVQAVSTLPLLPEIINFSFDTTYSEFYPRGGVNSVDTRSVKLVFVDDPGTKNFYMVSAEMFMPLDKYYSPDQIIQEGDSAWYPLKLQTEDAILEDDIDQNDYFSWNQLFFDDTLINGKIYTLNFGLSAARFYRSGNIRIIFSSITEDAFLFIKTKNKQREAGKDPFSEPVNVHSNIENGYGIFYGIATDTLAIRIH